VPVVILFQQVVRVVGRDQRKVVFPRHPDEPLVGDGLFRDGVVHNLEEEVLLSHDIPVEKRSLQRLFFAPVEYERRDFPREARGRNDQSFLVLRQQSMVYPRLAVETVGIRDGTEFDEVPVPLVGLRQEYQMVVLASFFPGGVSVGVDIDFAPDDRLDPRRRALIVKLDRPVHRAVIRHRDGGHAELDGLGREVAAADGAVEQAVLRMDVQVDKFSGHVLGIPRFISDPLLRQEAAPLHAPPASPG